MTAVSASTFAYPVSGENLFSLLQSVDPAKGWRRDLKTDDMKFLSLSKRRILDSADPREAVKALQLKAESTSPRHACERGPLLERFRIAKERNADFGYKGEVQLARGKKPGRSILKNAGEKMTSARTTISGIGSGGWAHVESVAAGAGIRTNASSNVNVNPESTQALLRLASKAPKPPPMPKLLRSTMQKWREAEARDIKLQADAAVSGGSSEPLSFHEMRKPPLPSVGSFGFPGSDRLDKLHRKKFLSLSQHSTLQEKKNVLSPDTARTDRSDGSRSPINGPATHPSPRQYEVDLCLYETDPVDLTWDADSEHRWSRPRFTSSWLEGHVQNIGYHLPHTFDNVKIYPKRLPEAVRDPETGNMRVLKRQPSPLLDKVWPRFGDGLEGVLRVGKDVKELKIPEYRKKIAYVRNTKEPPGSPPGPNGRFPPQPDKTNLDRVENYREQPGVADKIYESPYYFHKSQIRNFPLLNPVMKAALLPEPSIVLDIPEDKRIFGT